MSHVAGWAIPISLRRFVERIRELQPKKPQRQVPSGWWQDDKHVEQPPGSYLDPSLRLNRDGLPVGKRNRTR